MRQQQQPVATKRPMQLAVSEDGFLEAEGVRNEKAHGGAEFRLMAERLTAQEHHEAWWDR